MDGRDAVRVLRKNGFKAPVIMLTGADTDSDTILGLEAGANDYVPKPIDPDRLTLALRRSIATDAAPIRRADLRMAEEPASRADDDDDLKQLLGSL